MTTPPSPDWAELGAKIAQLHKPVKLSDASRAAMQSYAQKSSIQFTEAFRSLQVPRSFASSEHIEALAPAVASFKVPARGWDISALTATIEASQSYANLARKLSEIQIDYVGAEVVAGIAETNIQLLDEVAVSGAPDDVHQEVREALTVAVGSFLLVLIVLRVRDMPTQQAFNLMVTGVVDALIALAVSKVLRRSE